MTPTIKKIPIASIRRDSGAQFRVKGLNPNHAQNLHEALERGETLPPIVVFFDGQTNWMGDGDHRIEAHLLFSSKKIEAEVRRGTQMDARRFGRGANAAHGKPRDTATKKAQVLDALLDPEWENWSINEIAKACRVSWHFVNQTGTEHGLTSHMRSENRTYTTKHGTISTMDTGNIGRHNANNEANLDDQTSSVTTSSASEDHPWIAATDELPDPDVLVETGLLEDVMVGNIREGFVERKESGEVVAWNFDGRTEDSTVEWPCTHYRYKPPVQEEGEVEEGNEGKEDTGDDEDDSINQSDESTPSTGSTSNSSSNGNTKSGGQQSADTSSEPTLDAQIRALPLYQALSLYAHNGNVFMQEAAAWHECQSVIKAAQRAKSQIRSNTGPFSLMVRALANVPDPAEWQGCPPCKGFGRLESGDPCPRCRQGFVMYPGEGISAEAVRHHAESLIEAARHKATATSAPTDAAPTDTTPEATTETPDAVASTDSHEPSA